MPRNLAWQWVLNAARPYKICRLMKITVDGFMCDVFKKRYLGREVGGHHEYKNQLYYKHLRQYRWVAGTLVDMKQFLKSSVCSSYAD